jgi:Tfp pilus assembly protein PilE
MMLKRDHRKIGNAGVTLVEMLVVTLIGVLMVVGLGAAISATLTLEQNYREETGVRMALAHQMAYAERYFSLANGFDNDQARYPIEAGGVSFETNHWIQVTNMVLSVGVTNRLVRFAIASEGTNKNQEMMADGLLYRARGRMIQAGIKPLPEEIAEIRVPVRNLELRAEYEIRTRRGVETNTMTVSRPIRLWNY